MDFLITNGKVVSKQEANLTEFMWNEPFVLSQKVWFGFGGIPLFHENIDSIEKQLNTFDISLPALFKNKRELFRLTKRMLNKNKYYRSGFITYQFFISGKNINTLVTSIAFNEFEYLFSPHGLLVHFSGFRKKSDSLLERFKVHNQYLWLAARSQTIKAGLHSSILLNENDKVCEGLAANIFMVKDDVVITPSLDSGCYNDVLRPVVLELAKSENLKIIETERITQEHLLNMDEVFFASEEKGIQWILGVDSKRFVHEISGKIYDRLNSYLENKVL